MTEIQNSKQALVIGIWDFNKSMNFQQSKSPLGITKAWSSGKAFYFTRVTDLQNAILKTYL